MSSYCKSKGLDAHFRKIGLASADHARRMLPPSFPRFSPIRPDSIITPEALRGKLNKTLIDQKLPVPKHFTIFHVDPNIIRPTSKILEKEMLGSVVRQEETEIRRFIARYPSVFQVSHEFDLDASRVMIGRPMKTAYNKVIPVYVRTLGGGTYLTLAYKSESHAIWRRYAGRYFGSYYKGENQRFQDFHWKIQQALDLVATLPALEIKHPNGEPMKLTEFAPGSKVYNDEELNSIVRGLMIGTEDHIQEWMKTFAKNFEPLEPESFAAYWWSGNEDAVYGKHVKLVVATGDDRFLYTVSITQEGMFVSSINLNFKGVASVGAPTTPVIIRDEFSYLFTPILEYTEEAIEDAQLAKISDVDIHGTLLGVRGDRVRVEGLHESSRSPLRRLHNAVYDIPRLLRQGHYEAVEMKMQQIENGTIPLISDDDPAVPPADKLQKLAEKRLEILSYSYRLYAKGQLDEDSIRSLQLGPRDLQLIKRYFEHNENLKDVWPSLASEKFVDERLKRNAVQWARDSIEAEMHRTWIGVPLP